MRLLVIFHYKSSLKVRLNRLQVVFKSLLYTCISTNVGFKGVQVCLTVLTCVQWYSLVFNGTQYYSVLYSLCSIVLTSILYSMVLTFVQQYSKVFSSVQWCSIVLKGVQQYSKVFSSTQRCSVVLKGVNSTQQCSMVFNSTQRCSVVLNSVQKYSMVFRSTQWLSLIHI